MSKLKRDLSRVKVELARHYDRGTLFGKRLRRAVLADMLYVKHQGNGRGHLIGQFNWKDSPHGHRYWAERSGS